MLEFGLRTRPCALSMISSNESDEDSADEDDAFDVAPKPKHRFKAFYHYRIPLAISLVGELWFCCAMYDFKQTALADPMRLPGHVGDDMNLCFASWLIFVFFGIGRIFLVSAWRVSLGRYRDSTYAAWFMLFSTLQWVFYLSVYYRLMEELTGLTWDPKVLVKANNTHGSFEDSIMFQCLEQHDTKACVKKVNHAKVQCEEPFEPEFCSGYTWVGIEPHFEKCCVRNVYALQKPLGYVTLCDKFALLQWLAVLAMKWILENNPMLLGNTGAQFIQGATMDMLDAVVFGQYLLNDQILYPKYGIQYDGDKGAAATVAQGPYYLLYWTWLVAFLTAVLSPAVYTLCRRIDVRHAPEVRTYASSVSDLLSNLRMLHAKKSHALVEEAVKLQLEQYVSDSGGPADEHAVYVLDRDDVSSSDASPLNFSSTFKKMTPVTTANLKDGFDPLHAFPEYANARPGLASHKEGILYRVRYTDGEKPRNEIVNVTRLAPREREHHEGTRRCASGWCAGPQSAHDPFEVRAEVMDAVRSLFLLELPFLLWRLYFEWKALTVNSFTYIIMAKNVVWGFHDLLVILSCNNPAATICGRAPLPALSTMINGSAMSSVFIGPMGLFRIAADFTTATLKQKFDDSRQVLNLHKAWLLVERERLVQSRMRGRWDSAEMEMTAFSEAIQWVSSHMDALDKEEGMIHT